MNTFVHAAAVSGGVVWRALSWPFRGAKRMLALAWLIGTFLVGQAQLALADDGLIKPPDLAGGAAQTVFERIPLDSYTLPLQLSASHHGTPYIEETMWNVLNAIANVIIYITMALVKGAIACMQWLLDLSLYQDNKGTIDAAVQSLAAAVFWPLIGATVAVAGASMYARAKREGGGSIVGDATWVLAASILAITFAVAPSKVASDLDDVRTLVANAAIDGYSHVATAGDSAAGFPAVDTGTGATAASRELGDSMWNVYAVTPWCFTAFNSLDICKDVGKDYLEQSDRWKAFAKYQEVNEDEAAQYCPDEWVSQCDWVRGQSFARLGGALFAAMVGIPVALLLLALVIAGVMAILGFLMLLLVGLVFLVFWMIPGRPRAIGVRWLEALIGSLLQSVIITVVIGAVMVLSSVLNAGVGRYGLLMVVIFNVAAFLVAWKLRGMFENITGLASPVGGSPMSSYMAMKSLSALGRVAGGGRRALATPSALNPMAGIKAAGSTAGRAASWAGHKMAPLNTKVFASSSAGRRPAAATGSAGTSPVMREPVVTPYRGAGSGIPTQRPSVGAGTTVDAEPARAALPPPGRLALPASPSSTATRVTTRGGTPAFAAAGSGDGRRRIEQPAPRDILTPPAAGAAAGGRQVITYGTGGRTAGSAPYVATRGLKPLRRAAPSPTPSPQVSGATGDPSRRGATGATGGGRSASAPALPAPVPASTVRPTDRSAAAAAPRRQTTRPAEGASPVPPRAASTSTGAPRRTPRPRPAGGQQPPRTDGSQK